MRHVAIGFVLGAVLTVGGAWATEVKKTAVMADVDDEGGIKYAKGVTCEDALRASVGLVVGTDGKWFRPGSSSYGTLHNFSWVPLNNITGTDL